MKSNYEYRLKQILKATDRLFILDFRDVQSLREIYLELCLGRLIKKPFSINDKDKELIWNCYERIFNR
jgi:hypothetical protein